ncbi:MAG: FAD synthetase family protein [Oscillospiraceae bacterium]|jgi:riboflavin kinase/FMN adenylyltransferase|nr:FAD synthetase family protein [Oscillospiraceae bacterium]
MENKKIYTAVALGFFDGVHAGHQSIVKETIKYEKKGLIPIVYTFKQSPKAIISNKPYFYLTTNEKKINLLLGYGIKKVDMDDFMNIKHLFCEEFIYKIIKEKLNAKCVICGENYTFGYNAEGNCEKLKNICQKYQVQTHIVPPKMYKGDFISSSRIKKALKEHNFTDAEKMLGRKIKN